jgi:hypothetical protein
MSNISYLIPALRLYIWDVDSTAYRYTDEWLDASLINAVKSLQRWWNNKYLVDETDLVVSRSSTYMFSFDEPPLIQTSDETPLILMAAIVIKSGVLENSSWNTSTWRDAEYYVSNVEGGRMKQSSVKGDWDRLLMYLKPPQKRLNPGAREAFDFGADETT